MPFFIWSDDKLNTTRIPSPKVKVTLALIGKWANIGWSENKHRITLLKTKIWARHCDKTKTTAADREMCGEREELLVWLKKSREQLERGEDEKADWCTPGHSSAGTRHRSQNFYSHLKNTLRRRNANNETSAFHVRAERESEREREKNHYYSMRSKSPNVPSSKATSCSEPGRGIKKGKLWYSCLCLWRWAENLERQTVIAKIYNKASVSLYVGSHRPQRLLINFPSDGHWGPLYLIWYLRMWWMLTLLQYFRGFHHLLFSNCWPLAPTILLL